MTTKLGKWASNDGQITKSKLSDGCRAEFLPSVTGFDYDWLRFEDYLGNVGMYFSDRTLFGTAYPSRPLPESVEAFDAWEFEPGVKEKILYENALRIMKMDEKG